MTRGVVWSVAGGAMLALTAALAPPATTLGLALLVGLVSSAAVLEDTHAVALLWGVSVIPLYLTVPGFGFPIPLSLLVAAVLVWRTFVLRRQAPRFGTRADQVLVGIVVVGAGISTLLSAGGMRAWLNLLSLLLWLLLIPLARAIYRKPADIVVSVSVLAGALLAQACLGFVQLAAGREFTIGILTAPLAPVFFNANALAAKLARQDFNWAMFDRAFPSGLFINSIVYALCLITGGLTLLSAPRSWLPARAAGAIRACGAVALVAAFASFKVTAWVALIAGGMVLLTAQASRRQVPLSTAAIPMLLLLAAGGLTRQMVSSRVAAVLGGSALFRLVIWNAYLHSFPHGGWIGAGPGQAELLAPSLSTAAAGQILQLLAAPENSWIGLGIEIGVPATLALLILLIRLFAGGGGQPLRLATAAPALAAVLVGCTIGVHGLTDEHILPLVALIGGAAAALDAAEPIPETARLA